MLQTTQKNSSRKKFIQWSAAILASASIFKFLPVNKNKKPTTVKMLTQDGTLVEIDEAFLFSQRKKITDLELQQFVKKTIKNSN